LIIRVACNLSIKNAAVSEVGEVFVVFGGMVVGAFTLFDSDESDDFCGG